MMPLLDWAEARATDPITSQIAARAVRNGALNHESIRKRASGLQAKLVIYQHDQRICNHTGKLAQTYKVYR